MTVYNYVNTTPTSITIGALTIPGLSEVQSTTKYDDVINLRGSGIDVYVDSVLLPPTYAILNSSSLINSSGEIFALVESTPYVQRTTTGTVFTGPCELAGFDCIVAAGTITIYDNTSAAGNIVVPTTTLSVGRTEFQFKRRLLTGCHVVLSGAATVNILVG